LDDFFWSLKLERRNKAHRSNQANTSTKAYGAELTETQAQQQKKHTHTHNAQTKGQIKMAEQIQCISLFSLF
jgi:hypothetical protein